MSLPLRRITHKTVGIASAIAKQSKLLNIKPLSKLTVQFDPFHEQVEHTRKFAYCISATKILKTNLSCIFKTNIVCDRSEPLVTCDLGTGEKVIFKCGNLDTLDILKLFNKHISSLVPKEEPVETGRPKKKKKLRIKRRIPRSRR